VVYFILGKLTRRIKIGYSKHSGEVDTRFHYLRRDNSDDLELLGRIDGEIADEQALHAEVEHYRAHNEWFMAEPEVISLVARELSVEPAAISERVLATEYLQGVPNGTPREAQRRTEPQIVQ